MSDAGATLERADADSAVRAATAARSVRELFGARLLGIPGTYLPHVTYPGRSRLAPWHYWWLAHFVDCLVDESARELRSGSDRTAQHAAALAYRLLRTIRTRNGGRFTNHYYDDMAWLLLAAQRLHRLAEHEPLRAADRRLTTAATDELAAAVRSGESPDFRGGIYWNDRRDFKNVAATGPTAVYLARAGETAHARQLVEWMYATLFNPRTGLVDDGVSRASDGHTSVASGTYTYNQGVVLGALVELADEPSLTRAASLVAAVEDGLASRSGPPVLATYGGGDGGLFTGIAARYLALAARCPSLAPSARRRAASMVRATADALWEGRQELPGRHRSRPEPADGSGMPSGPVSFFSPDPAQPAARAYPPGSVVDLSTQLQAWMLLEGAHTLEQA